MRGVKCKNNVQVVQCLNNVCDTVQCPNILDPICVPSNCGQCSVHLFNSSGDDITSSCISVY